MKISFQEFNSFFFKKNAKKNYLLFGNESILINKYKKYFKSIAINAGFTQHFSFDLITEDSIKNIILECKTLNLFNEKKLFIINYNDKKKHINIDNDLIKIIQTYTNILFLLIKDQRKSSYNDKLIQFFQKNNVLINCNIYKQDNISSFILFIANQKKLILDQKTLDLFKQYYENNIEDLYNTLEICTLLFPNKKVSYLKVKNTFKNSSFFMPFHWINAIFSQNVRKTIYILRVMQSNNIEILLLLRILQKHMLSIMKDVSFYKKFNNFIKKDFIKIFQQLIIIEKNIKTNDNKNTWITLERISLFLANIKIFKPGYA
ncbi:DNA polymerase III subunit delta [Candidatus Tachikawaea gelatinosa]|uniref:DNA polymerase III subunit delta n=1 Tax=Candidatus Tachikawaea gelatinosa TaxID=1410383 RepID=A0A090AJ81_9ENTR|nr:DNA polymerase III subunit delta [Candidatus Tachikawaea gelatinosa]BAP58498.1 DNA polymerase III- delta subunit [Candidatus Tachikawaea gelatinosa]